MPELPEVETVARGLQREIAGRRVGTVEFGKVDFVDNPEEMERQLPGRVIRAVERYGKFLLLRLEEGSNGHPQTKEAALLVHLGMTGMLRPRAPDEAREKHTHVVLQLDDGRELRYVDARRFGRMAYLEGEKLHAELARFGADPLQMSLEEFSRRVRGRSARIKALLLDQRVLRGVGNIYADEGLWKARIHPASLGKRLKEEQVKKLYRALQDVLRQAIVMRGSSISDFLDAEGLPGEYQRRHRAYGREGKKCFRCGGEIRRIIVAGRSSFFCDKCQRALRTRRKVRKQGKR